MKKEGKQNRYQIKFSPCKQCNQLQDQVVLEKRWVLPSIKGTGFPVHKLNDYYQRVIRQWQKRWDGELYWRSGIAFATCKEQGRAFLPWNVELTQTVTYQSEAILSLVTEVREQWGKTQCRWIKYGDVWHLPSGTPALPWEFLNEKNGKKYLKQRLYEQFQEMGQREGSHLPEMTQQQFCKLCHMDRFAWTDRGLEFYIPQRVFIQGQEGILTFFIPLDANQIELEKLQAQPVHQ